MADEPKVKGKVLMTLYEGGKIRVDVEKLSLSELATMHFELGSLLNEKFTEQRRKAGVM